MNWVPVYRPFKSWWLTTYLLMLILSPIHCEVSHTNPFNSAICMSSGLFCDFETDCNWNWTRPERHNAGFKVYSFDELNKTAHEAPYHTFKGLMRDPKNETKDHILFLSLRSNENYSNQLVQLWSPWYEETSGESCRLEALISIYQFRDVQMPIKVLIENQNNTGWAKFSRANETQKYNDRWNRYKTHLGRITSRFRVLIEVLLGHMRPAYVAIDNIRMDDCFTDMPPSAGECCGIRCDSGNKCITPDHICDLDHDCDSGEDEAICDEMPLGSRCDFERNGTCGWANHDKNHMDWELQKGVLSEISSRGQADHTFGNTSGHYMLSDLPSSGVMGQEAMLESPIFQPPPCANNNASSPWYQSCRVRFHYQKRGKDHGMMMVDMIPQNTFSPKRKVDNIMGDIISVWMRFSKTLPLTDYPYRIRITNIRGTTFRGDLAIDDFSMSPACFGIGLPEDMQASCPVPDTTTETATTSPIYTSTNKPPGIRSWILTPCGAKGHEGPIQSQCHEEYRKQELPIPVVQSSPEMHGYQTWKVPQDGYYTFIAKGASGGSGVRTQKIKTSGSMVRGVFFLKRNTDVFFLIGQEGKSACTRNTKGNYLDRCHEESDPPDESEGFNSAGIGGLKQFKNKIAPGGAGGGGGGTYVFTRQGHDKIPLLVAGGGGGLAWEPTLITDVHNGRGVNASIEPINGETTYQEGDGAGPGGGMKGNRDGIFAGYPLTTGGVGGPPCTTSWNTYGGFGGGGGGCFAGGGGGGYAGGNAGRGAEKHGDGGTSFVSGEYTAVDPASNYGDGVVFIISAAGGQCNCNYLCAYLDEEFNDTVCLCGKNQILADDGFTCKVTQGQLPYALSAAAVLFLILCVLGTTFLCSVYKNKKRPISGVGGEILWPLSRGQGSMGRMTDNPNYEFNTCPLKDLKPISRENLKFVKPLGQGAFGEVYKGYLRNYASDCVEMPVAVKTLPDISSKEAEMDFLMEAFIMYKFSHPNIVHFIGICFEKLPRLIVLELLSGGDLKSFLREARPCPDRPSPLAMKDLLQCAIDVSKGCEYLEENHFIHRDIAARNCLLTSRGPGRVVKIADFGMARDIYRNDYYKKGGKAMLPVKWMPPEAFLDGIFTSKTDIWSFGVLLWEVMSLGYMPYPGRTNQEVMQLVTNGGRLEPPTNCPPPVYRIMTQCWHPTPDERPTFRTILERLGYCIQDPNVTSATLPVFQRPPSFERDATVMRPADGEACLAVMRRPNGDASDYLIPLPSSFSLASVKSAFRSNPSLELEKDHFQMEQLIGEATVPPPPTWETSFTDEPPAINAPRRPNSPSESRSPPQLSNIQDDNSGASPLLISPPNSNSPPLLPRSQDSRERLISPGEMETSLTIHPNNVPPLLHGRPRDRSRAGQHYQPHRHNNSGSSNNSCSSTASSSTGSNSSNNNSSSTASTLPLDPATLPCIPPPQQYVNVEVKKRSPDFTQEPYTIVETREHREISC